VRLGDPHESQLNVGVALPLRILNGDFYEATKALRSGGEFGVIEFDGGQCAYSIAGIVLF
jgi:hypothetical protein